MTIAEPQLHMVWPRARLTTPPTPRLPVGYTLRTYQPSDEARFYAVMALAGWPGWDDAKLAPWKARILPQSWFMAIDQATAQIVATAMGLHSHEDELPFGGELGWVASDPAHRGKGLGMAVAAAVTARLLVMGYDQLHLYTEDWRLPALKGYLRLGYVPLLAAHGVEIAGVAARWQTICTQLQWPYTPEQWRIR